MTWGGSYSGLQQWGVTVVRLQPVFNTIPISQARTLPIGDTVTVQGILTADRIITRYTGYMQDATAGIAIYDVAANHLMGVVVFQKQHLLMNKGSNILTLNLNNLAEGVYTLSVQGDKNVINQRLVIKK